MTLSAILTQLTVVLDVVYGMFTNVITTITSNALIFLPVLMAFLSAIIAFAISVIRKLGVRGTGGGRRRRGRR